VTAETAEAIAETEAAPTPTTTDTAAATATADTAATTETSPTETQTAALPDASFTPPATTADSSKGQILVDAGGKALYTFDTDTVGKSNCTGECAVNWPPLLAPADATGGGDWSVVTRDDGTRQWAYKGKPLYTWLNDKQAGDVTGDGVNDTWHLAKP
jgi:predicted lipoprotein with Yx(FWY)xxD motif